MEYDFTLADLFKAYYDCRKNKRCKKCALKFELNLEQNLLKLYKEIKSGRYKIGRCICFVVTSPKPREVWAANFRDRIVHHLIYNFISERFHKRFIHDTYSCIPKKGTLAAGKRLQHFTRSITNNYTKNCFYLKADLSNFFVSINKTILFNLIKEQVHEEWLLALIEQIVFNDPTKNVYIKSSRKKMKLIPPHKSLFNTDKNHGLPIGNLTSQFFSNIYLNELDQYVKRELACKYYVRYVDDFVLLADNAGILNCYFNKIRLYMLNSIEVKLHPRKKLINKITNGVDFVGYFIRPGRILFRKRTKNKIFAVVKNWQNLFNKFAHNILSKLLKTVNSYFGMAIHLNEFELRFSLSEQISSLFMSVDFGFTKMCLCVK